MFDPATLHADLLAYCARIGIAPTTFGQHVLRDSAFAASLLRGRSGIGKVALAQRFMREHPEALPRQFGAIAKAWRERVATEEEAGGEARHPGDPAAAVAADGAVATSSTAGTLVYSSRSYNQESQSEDSAPAPAGDPAALARILALLGGHEAVAMGARIAVTDLEAMEAEGRVWSQYHRALTAGARATGYDLDPATLAMRPLGRDYARRA